MKPSIETCYKLLDVSPDCTPEDLKRSHKDLVQVWHPDRFGSNTELQQKALNKVQEINSAYDLILGYRSLKAKSSISGSSPKDQPSSGTYAMEGRDSARLASPLVPIKLRIIMLLGFGTCLIILLVLLSQKYSVTGQNAGELTIITNHPNNLEIRDETYLIRQHFISRLKTKLNSYLLGFTGKQNFSVDIGMEVDAESKMILQTKISIRIDDLNILADKSGLSEKSSLALSCQKPFVEELKKTIFRIARLVPARGDQVDITCIHSN